MLCLIRIIFKVLEPYAVKVARTVLRGLGGSNAPWLPDQWSQKLEKRVKESEDHTAAMEEIIEKQRKQIKCLEQKVDLMEKKNQELLKELNAIKKMNEHERE